MYFGWNDAMSAHSRLDIDGDKDIVRFNRQETDNKSRKNIASYLRSRICERDFRFNRDIETNKEEELNIVLTDEDIDFNNIDMLCLGDIEFKRKRFKNSYNNVKMFLVIKNGEDSYFLREGCRYLSPEESCHIIDLIDKSNSITFYIDKDAWIKIQKET